MTLKEEPTKNIINIEDDNQLKKVINWSFEHDELLSNWADHASCYTWMHDTTQRKFKGINMWLGVPVIILSTVSGTANFGISTIFPAGFSYGNAIIGTLSLITGVISTVSNFLGYAQAEEAHRISSIQWSKFKRTIETELSLHPDEREPPSDFIKHNKAELDRLMEQSPIIPKDVIAKFIKIFRKVKNVKMPEICNKLEPTTIYSELFTTRQTMLDKKNINDPITLSDKSIIKSVTEKINSFFTTKKENTSEKEEENDNVVVVVNDENKNIENYSNASPIVSKQDSLKPEENKPEENKLEENKPEENKPEETSIQNDLTPDQALTKSRGRILAKQLVDGKK
jgi:hypothetical protein